MTAERKRRNKPVTLHRCQDCGRLWDEADLKELKDVFQRVLPGEPMPSGECPSCGAACRPDRWSGSIACPKCGEDIYLTRCEFVGKMLVDNEGCVDFNRAPRARIRGEKYRCEKCGPVPVKWVRGQLSRRAALLRMTPTNAARKRAV